MNATEPQRSSGNAPGDNAPPTVLHIIDSLGTGGAEALVVDLAIEGLRRGGRHSIVTLWHADGVPYRRALAAGVTVRTMARSRKLSLFGTYRLRSWARQADVIHVHLFPALYLAATLPRRRAVKLYTEHSTSNRRRRWYVFRFLDRVVYRRYSWVVAVSEGVRASLIEHLPSLAGRTRVVMNGVGSQFYADVADDRLVHRPLRLLTVGRLEPLKNQSAIIDALRSIPDAELFIAGRGNHEPELRRRVAGHGLASRVHFLGECENVIELMDWCDILVHAPIHEGFGLVIAEAMVRGLPVAASDIAGIRDVVENDESGLLFDPHDTTAIVAAIRVLATNDEKRVRLVGSAKRTATRFGISRALDQYLVLYATASPR